MWPRRIAAILATGVLTAATAAAGGAVVLVPGEAPTIQAGIDQVDVGGTVIVSPGVYNELIDFQGKALTLGPIGPWLVTPDEVGDPHVLDIWLEVDGHRYQNGNTRTMIYRVPFLVHYLSQFMSLHPGDVISTGTPPGVGLGLDPPTYLEVGQTMQLGIQGLGQQRQRVIAAP